MPTSRRASFVACFLILSTACFAAAEAWANPWLKPLVGMHFGPTWTYGALASNPGKLGIPVAGLHLLISQSRRLKFRTYWELQNFRFRNERTLFDAENGNRAFTFLFMPAYQLYGTPLGNTYIAAGAGMGFHSSFGQSVPWLAAAWGSHFKRMAFFEIRGQFNLKRDTLQDMYFAAMLGIHFNPHEATWKESLAEEGVR
ncbi:MAG: hypothetical protein IT285_03200 [Bdellovibrionales bacterium]|nr:hypothetical protein [Bdellovibrionales bacterium]